MRLLSRGLTPLLICLLLVQPLLSQELLQHYDRGKVFLKSGANLEGKNLSINSEAVVLDVNGQLLNFSLDEVAQVMARDDAARKYALYCGGLSFLLGFSPVFQGDTEATVYYEDGSEEEVDMMPLFLLVGIGLTTLGVGVGYFAGKMTSDWQVVYLSRD